MEPEERPRPGRPVPVGARRVERPRIEMPDADETTGIPEAQIQEHELLVEREPWAKYTGALAGMRIAAAIALRAKRKAAGEYVTPHPWFPALVTTALVAGGLLVIWLVASVVQRFV